MKSFFAEFKEFALRGNVIDLAVGIIIGAAFNSIVTSFVNDVLMPPIGMALGRVDFRELFVTLGSGRYDTLAEAEAAGAATINYGLFINALISFLLTALAVFLLVRAMNRLRRSDDAEPESTPTTRPCPHCFKEISRKANKCPFCTADIMPDDNRSNLV